MGFSFILRGIAKEFFGLSFWDSLEKGMVGKDTALTFKINSPVQSIPV